MPVSGAHLGSALPSVGTLGRNPLSSHTPKQRSLPSPAGPNFSPDSLLASCGALAPFRLSSCQPQSSPWGLTSEAWASAPSPHPPQQVSRQASQAGECWSAPILCAAMCPLCPLHPCCCALLRGSEASPRPTPCLHQWRGFLVCGNFSSFAALSQRCGSHPYSFVSVFSFFFCPTQVHGDFLAFWEVWGLLPAFCRCSVGVVPHLDVVLMYLLGGSWSLCLIPPPPWRSPLPLYFERVVYNSIIVTVADWFRQETQTAISSPEVHFNRTPSQLWYTGQTKEEVFSME